MQVCPFTGDALACVAGAAHCCNDFTGFPGLANTQAARYGTQMSVQRVHRQAVNLVLHDDVVAVV